jgi:predicted PurR-regulated permease PerM
VQFVDLAGATIRNVSRGVVGVALLQAILLGVVFQIAGVPGAGLLAVLALMFCLAQLGPSPVVVPVAIWAWLTMPAWAALVLTLALGAISALDHSLKPLLMSRGLTTPTLVILLGVIGGTISHGLLGLFLGPIVLAVLYDLVLTWSGPAETADLSVRDD